MDRVIVRALLGVVVVGFIVASNRQIFRRVPYGPRLSGLEWAYYVFGVTTVVLGWYFAFQFMSQNPTHSGNPLWGAGSWTDYRIMMFASPASSAASQDLTIANLVLLPLFTHHRRLPTRGATSMAVLRRKRLHQLRVRVGVLSRDGRTAAARVRERPVRLHVSLGGPVSRRQPRRRC